MLSADPTRAARLGPSLHETGSRLPPAQTEFALPLSTEPPRRVRAYAAPPSCAATSPWYHPAVSSTTLRCPACDLGTLRQQLLDEASGLRFDLRCTNCGWVAVGAITESVNDKSAKTPLRGETTVPPSTDRPPPPAPVPPPLPPSKQPQASPVRRVMLWGLRASGKSTYLASLFIKRGELPYGSAVRPVRSQQVELLCVPDQESQRYLRTLADKLQIPESSDTTRTSFPPGTAETEEKRVSFDFFAELGGRQEYLEVSIPDRAGGLFVDLLTGSADVGVPELLEEIVNSSALMILVDPAHDEKDQEEKPIFVETSFSSNLNLVHAKEIERAKKDGRRPSMKIAKDVAVVLTKAERYWDRADEGKQFINRLGFHENRPQTNSTLRPPIPVGVMPSGQSVGYYELNERRDTVDLNETSYEFERVPLTRAITVSSNGTREFLREHCGTIGQKLITVLEQHFDPTRITYHAVSAVGMLPGHTNAPVPNIEMLFSDDGRFDPHIRDGRRMTPIDVFDPLFRLVLRDEWEKLDVDRQIPVVDIAEVSEP